MRTTAGILFIDRSYVMASDNQLISSSFLGQTWLREKVARRGTPQENQRCPFDVPSRSILLRVILTLLILVFLNAGAYAQASNWQTFTSSSSDLAVQVPVDLFRVDKGPAKVGVGRSFATEDGRADLGIYTLDNRHQDSPGTFFNRNFQLPQGASVSYRKITGRILAVSGLRGSTIWYARCNFSRTTIKCIALNYPAHEKREWDRIVTRISNSLS